MGRLDRHPSPLGSLAGILLPRLVLRQATSGSSSQREISHRFDRPTFTPVAFSRWPCRQQEAGGDSDVHRKNGERPSSRHRRWRRRRACFGHGRPRGSLGHRDRRQPDLGLARPCASLEQQHCLPSQEARSSAYPGRWRPLRGMPTSIDRGEWTETDDLVPHRLGFACSVSSARCLR